MTDQDERYETFEIEERSQPGLLRRMPWWLIGSIAFAIGELTTHPAIGIVVLCLKFGWNDFLLGLWLRRRDPDRKRGAVCSWFYWALGLWRVGMWSFILLFAFAFFVFGLLEQHVGKGRDPIELGYCAAIMFGSVILGLGTTSIGMLRGWMTGRRVWLSSNIYESYKLRVWPPVTAAGSPNLLKRIIIMTGCIAYVAALPAILFGVFALLGNPQVQPGKPNAQDELITLAGILTVIIGGACVVLWICSAILKRLEADRPDQRWAEPEAHDDSWMSPHSNDEAWR